MNELNAQPTAPAPTQLSAGRAAWLQLLPGIASLPVFALLAMWFSDKHIPNMFALILVILIVEVPVTWAIIVRHVRRENNGKFSYAQAFPWRSAIPWWVYIFIGVPALVLSMVMIAGVDPKISAYLLNTFFSLVPDWFVMQPDPAMFIQLSRPMLLSLWVMTGLGMVLVGGFTQEFYSRGFLLPRTEQLGNWAPAYNALMFAIFHLIAPWSWMGFFLMTLPWAYLVWWRRSVRIGIFLHVGMLALQWMGMTALVFGLVPVPG